MAKPRVFVSSTYYDLKHLRSSIENFIESMGYEPVLSEKDNIAYTPDAPLDESCFREARNSDVYVLIIGGRYGSEISAHKDHDAHPKEFYDRYESITKHEYLNAIERNIPIYILIDAAVDAEYQTYLKNKESKSIKYAHVDSVNVFVLIGEIRQRKQNNPVKLFSRYAEIETWLREQWAGLFREFIHRLSATQQLHDLSAKIEELGQTTETLKRYLEQVVESVSDKNPAALQIIKEENARLITAKREAEFLSFGYIKHLHRSHDIELDSIRAALRKNETYGKFVNVIFPKIAPPCIGSKRAFEEVNEARLFLDLPPFDEIELGAVKGKVAGARKRILEAQAVLEDEAKRRKKPAVKRVSKPKPKPKRTEH